MANQYTAMLTFYTQTWDEYHTRTLTLGIVSGPVEGILTLCIVYGVTAFVGGGSFWQRSVLESVGIENSGLIPDFFYNLAWDEWYMIYGGIMLVFNTWWR
jgi:ethanolaminephosphotransferase